MRSTTLGRTITPEAVTLLIEAVGGDLAQLAVELEKLASYSTEAIDEHAVADVVGVRRGESLGDLLDAVAAKDVGAAIGLIPIVLQLPKTNAVSIVMALTVADAGARLRGSDAARPARHRADCSTSSWRCSRIRAHSRVGRGAKR